MKRMFYLSLGVAAGVYASRRLARRAEAWTPAGVADRAAGVGTWLRQVAAEVRTSATAREDEIRGQVGLSRHSAGARIDPTGGA